MRRISGLDSIIQRPALDPDKKSLKSLKEKEPLLKHVMWDYIAELLKFPEARLLHTRDP